MKFELFPFQMKAVRRLRNFLMVAQANYKLTDVPQAISFTAQTDAIFVWLSDSPELNQQSYDKLYFNADGMLGKGSNATLQSIQTYGNTLSGRRCETRLKRRSTKFILSSTRLIAA